MTRKKIYLFLLILGILFLPYFVFILSSNPGTFGLISGIMGMVGAVLVIGAGLWHLWKIKSKEKV